LCLRSIQALFVRELNFMIIIVLDWIWVILADRDAIDVLLFVKIIKKSGVYGHILPVTSFTC
jgi:hypothetical protein